MSGGEERGSAMQSGADSRDRNIFLLYALGMLCVEYILLLYSFSRGLDATDEADYLYQLTHPDRHLFVMDQFVWGHLGRLVGATAFDYRLAALALTQLSALFLACGVWRYLRQRGAVAPWFVLVAFAATGALGYFSLIRPTLSYTTSAAAGVDIFFAALLYESGARKWAARLLFLGAAIFGMTIASLARLYLAPLLLFFGILCIFLVSPERKLSGKLRAIGLFLLLFAAAALLLRVLGYRAEEQIRSLRLIGDHSFGDILAEDIRIGWWVLRDAGVAGAELIVLYGVLLLSVHLFFRKAEFWRRALAAGAAGMSALVTAIGVLRTLPRAPNAVSASDGFFGVDAPHIYTEGLPLLTLIVLFAAIWLSLECFSVWAGTGSAAAMAGAHSPARAGWIRLRLAAKDGRQLNTALIVFAVLALAQCLPFVGTNTGLFIRSIMNLGPGAILLAVALLALTARFDIASSRILLAVYVPFSLAMFGLVVGNSILAPFRVNGSTFDQTVPLADTGILKGLLVSPAMKGIKQDIDRGLRRAQFRPTEDRVITGLDQTLYALFSGGTTLGPTRIFGDNSSAEDDRLYCTLIANENMAGVRRVIGINAGILSPGMRTCLAAKGVDFQRKTDYAVNPRITISVIPVVSGP